jgi:uncharacterized protein HemX
MENAPTDTEKSRTSESDANTTRGSNIPFAITLAALLVYFGFQTVQLIAQRSELSAVKSSQDAALQAAQNVQQQFNTIMTKTSELAKQGHAGAKMVLEGLQRIGGPGQQPGQ